jgi:hypothetical protein
LGRRVIRVLYFLIKKCTFGKQPHNQNNCMQPNYSTKEKTFRIIAFVLCLITLVAQFIIMMQGAASDEIMARTIRFFSFMTILTNILVALTYIFPLTFPSSKAAKFFAKPNTQSAVLVYITIVCLGYHFLLAKIWKPQGLQYWVDKSLHYYVPVGYFIFYVLFVKKGTLVYNNMYRWLIYPFVYLVYAITRGLITNDYPYPFLDLHKHEMSKVLTVMAVVFTGYVIISLLVIFYDKNLSKKSITRSNIAQE